MNTFKLVNTRGDTIIGRISHCSVVHGGRLYIVMGSSIDAILGDMCWTDNLQTWKSKSSMEIIGGGAIPARDSFGLCHHNNKVYLAGGWSGSARLNDIYVSTDMFRWKQLQNVPWAARTAFNMLSFKDRLWVIGGRTATGYQKDIWWSTDGAKWVQEPNAPWSARDYFAAFVYNNKVYVIGGIGTGSVRNNEVWCSDDMRKWTHMGGATNFAARAYHAVVPIDVEQKIMLIGGETGSSVYSNEIWHSGQGCIWKLGGTVPFSHTSGCTMDYFDSRIVIVGGCDNSVFSNEVWVANNNLFKSK